MERFYLFVFVVSSSLSSAYKLWHTDRNTVRHTWHYCFYIWFSSKLYALLNSLWKFFFFVLNLVAILLLLYLRWSVLLLRVATIFGIYGYAYPFFILLKNIYRKNDSSTKIHTLDFWRKFVTYCTWYIEIIRMKKGFGCFWELFLLKKFFLMKW